MASNLKTSAASKGDTGGAETALAPLPLVAVESVESEGDGIRLSRGREPFVLILKKSNFVRLLTGN